MVPRSGGEHFGVRAEMAEADWPIITDLAAEVVEILQKEKTKQSLSSHNKLGGISRN